jgi:CRISPR-associated protein Cmr4
MDVVVNDYRRAFPTKERWQEICQDVEETLPEEFVESETASENALRQLGYIGKRPSRGKDESEDQFQERQRAYWQQVKTAHQACKHALQTLTWESPADIVSLGLEWAEHLGIGGMGTRGFGRIRIESCKQVKNRRITEDCEDNAHGDTGNTEH